MNIKNVGQGTVQLIAGGGKTFTDIAARFCRSEKSLGDIISSPYDSNIVKNILGSGHMAGVEFDYFIFGVEGYARVTEIQLARKRIASYLIKSGRAEKHCNRSFDMVLPKDVMNFSTRVIIDANNVILPDGDNTTLKEKHGYSEVALNVNPTILLDLIEHWYEDGVDSGLKEEELRYLKPQATEFKAIIGMNAHALIDWFKIRTCMNAQTEIRDMATKMLVLCKEAAPDLFANAGASCVSLGYCPENDRQNKRCKGRMYTKDQALEVLRQSKIKKVL